VGVILGTNKQPIMRIKKEIEWVFGELPETGAIKMVTVEVVRENRRYVAQAQWDGEKWRVLDWSGKRGDPLLSDGEVPVAWGDVAPCPKFPTEGQKVEFDGVHICENQNADKARFQRLVIAVEFIARNLSIQIGNRFSEAGIYERIELSRTTRRLDTIKGYIMEGEGAGL
jgi:hypothetical protein